MKKGIAAASIYSIPVTGDSGFNQKSLFEQRSTPLKGDATNSPPHQNTSSNQLTATSSKKENHKKPGILNHYEVGNLLKPKKQIEWDKVEINIPKELMDVVEMDCDIRPEIRDHYDSLMH